MASKDTHYKIPYIFITGRYLQTLNLIQRKQPSEEAVHRELFNKICDGLMETLIAVMCVELQLFDELGDIYRHR